jgi:hypothetical protein
LKYFDLGAAVVDAIHDKIDHVAGWKKSPITPYLPHFIGYLIFLMLKLYSGYI